MGSYLDIARQAMELLASPIPVAAGSNPEAAVPGPDDVGGRQQDDDGDPFADWVRRPYCQGRMVWQAPGLSEVVPFDDLPLPGLACPTCKSLESWTDLLGRQRCGVCEADTLDKALKLAERAARLRQQSQPRQSAPRFAPGCVAAGRVDILDLDSKRPATGQLRGFDGV